jgi:hypothetical protein
MFSKNHQCGTENHRFEARYDEVPIVEGEQPQASPAFWGYEASEIVDLQESHRRMRLREVYVRDVCRYCGKEIKR